MFINFLYHFKASFTWCWHQGKKHFISIGLINIIVWGGFFCTLILPVCYSSIPQPFQLGGPAEMVVAEEKRGWFRAHACATFTNAPAHTCTLTYHFCSLVPDELRPGKGLQTRSWEPLCYSNWKKQFSHSVCFFLIHRVHPVRQGLPIRLPRSRASDFRFWHSNREQGQTFSPKTA